VNIRAFFDNKLDFTAGARAPFLRRPDQQLLHHGGNGNLDCLGNSSMNAAYATAHPTYAAPAAARHRLQPRAAAGGLHLQHHAAGLFFANYSKGMQIPGTDNLYQCSTAANSSQAHPAAETTNNSMPGVRFAPARSWLISRWYTLFQNRLASAL
jgi:iron complex outermembrane receptor protein